MAAIHLTDRTIRALRTEARQEDFPDDQLSGLALRVSRWGRKCFIFRYRVSGRRRRLTLGTYPALSLARARELAREALRTVSQGGDPQTQKRERLEAMTVSELAVEYLERHAKRRKKSWAEDQRKLDRDILPTWGNLPARDIHRRDVTQLLEKIMDRGSPVSANRTLALVSRIFNFGIDEEILEHNPAQRIRPPAKERPRDRVLSESEIKALWPALDLLDPVMGASFRLRLLTAQRGVEVLSMRWQDEDGDWWTIPAGTAKNGLAHRVPLSPQALAILEALRPLTGESEWVFASPRKSGAHITAVRKAAERLCAAVGFRFTPHDLRRTAASHMASMGIQRLVISKVLNHAENGVTAVYDRHSYDQEKRSALDRWGARLEEITQGKAASNVVTFGRR